MLKMRNRFNSIMCMLTVILLLCGSSTLSSCSSDDDQDKDLVESQDKGKTQKEASNATLTDSEQEPLGDEVEYLTDDYSYGDARITKKVTYALYRGMVKRVRCGSSRPLWLPATMVTRS